MVGAIFDSFSRNMRIAYMKIKTWNIYLTRGGVSRDTYRIEEARPVLITRWVEREKRSIWEGWAWWSARHRGNLSGPFWFAIHGNVHLNGQAGSLDLTEHLISVRDLLTRKLNPPPLQWTLRAYARYSENALFL